MTLTIFIELMFGVTTKIQSGLLLQISSCSHKIILSSSLSVFSVPFHFNQTSISYFLFYKCKSLDFIILLFFSFLIFKFRLPFQNSTQILHQYFKIKCSKLLTYKHHSYLFLFVLFLIIWIS